MVKVKYKWQKQLLFLLGFVVVAFISFIGGVIHSYGPLIGDEHRMVNTVLRYPDVFQFDKVRRTFIITTLKTCKDMTRSNWNDTLFGDTFESAQEECMDKVVDTIRSGITEGNKYDTERGYTNLFFGNSSNAFQAYAVNTRGFTAEETDTYVNNISTLVEALPENIPSIDILKSLVISQVRYFDHYAQIKYNNDHFIEDLAKRGTSYKGQF